MSFCAAHRLQYGRRIPALLRQYLEFSSRKLGTIESEGQLESIWYFHLMGLRGWGPHVGKTQARNPTDRSKVGRGPAREGDLRAAAGSVLMRTTCVRGTPVVCDARFIGGVVNHTAVIRIAWYFHGLLLLCKSSLMQHMAGTNIFLDVA